MGGYGRRNEKGEKNEKREKNEKGEKREKNEGGSLLGALVGGSIVIWLGLTFFLEQNGYFDPSVWWAYFVGGVGIILILQGVVLFTRGHNGIGAIIGGAVALFIGASSIAALQYNFSQSVWPLLIVFLGVFILAGGVMSRRRVPKP